MDHFYITLPSDSSGYYFPRNTIANFRTKLATPIELEPDKWEVGLVEVSYPKGYTKQPVYNTLRVDSMDIKIQVRHYTSLHHLFSTMGRYFKSDEEKNQFIVNFNSYLNKHSPPDGYMIDLISVCYGQNSIQIADKLVSHFPVRVYKDLEDLAKTIMTPANCRYNRVVVPQSDNCNFETPEPVYVYTDIIKPNLVGDSYVTLLATLHFPASTGYHRFYYPLYRPVEQTFIESIGFRLITKFGEDSDIPSLVILNLKRSPHHNLFQFIKYHGSLYMILYQSKRW